MHGQQNVKKTPNNSFENIYIFLNPPFNSVAKKLFLGSKKYWGEAFASLRRPSYACGCFNILDQCSLGNGVSAIMPSYYKLKSNIVLNIFNTGSSKISFTKLRRNNTRSRKLRVL